MLKNTGFKVHGERIGSISYVDDKVLIGKTPQQLQKVVSKLNKESQKLEMKVNVDENGRLLNIAVFNKKTGTS